DLDDDARSGSRHVAYGTGTRAWFGLAPLDRHRRDWRSVALRVAHSTGDAGDLLYLRRYSPYEAVAISDAAGFGASSPDRHVPVHHLGLDRSWLIKNHKDTKDTKND